GCAVFLELARTVAEPAVDITYLFYECEEVSQRHNGLVKLAEARPELLAADAAVLGEPTGGVVEAGCQGTLRVDVTLAGARAHTARPWMGRNAVHRLGPVRRSTSPPRAKLGWTDVSFFAGRGVPATNYGPGDPNLAHTPGEHVSRAELDAVHATLAALLADDLA